MANGKTHLLVGAGAGIALDYLWQRSQMEQDPNRKFDWGELAIVGAGGAFFGILTDVLEPATNPNHRNFFHSIAFVFLLLWALGKLSGCFSAKVMRYVAMMALCYLSHLFLDSGTPRSLPLIGRWRS